jgi:hypothetical protein
MSRVFATLFGAKDWAKHELAPFGVEFEIVRETP